MVAGLVAGPPADAPSKAPLDPDLARVAAAWATLPEPVKAGVLAMVAASEAQQTDAG